MDVEIEIQIQDDLDQMDSKPPKPLERPTSLYRRRSASELAISRESRCVTFGTSFIKIYRRPVAWSQAEGTLL
jgi:hypothetical protein